MHACVHMCVYTPMEILGIYNRGSIRILIQKEIELHRVTMPYNDQL